MTEAAVVAGEIFIQLAGHAQFAKAFFGPASQVAVATQRQAGTTTVLASITDVRLKSNSVYTVWLQGVNGTTNDTKLSAKLQENVYYN